MDCLANVCRAAFWDAMAPGGVTRFGSEPSGYWFYPERLNIGVEEDNKFLQHQLSRLFLIVLGFADKHAAI